jgi:RNA 2',3'-cyclic 3'-phosphodiesterase
MADEKFLRLFLAIACRPGSEILELQQELIRLSQNPSAKLRPVHSTDLHITLKFLGPVAVNKIHGIEKIMDAVALTYNAFHCHLQGLGFFRGAIWLGIRQDGSMASLTALAAGLDTALAETGFHREKKVYRPHMTVARLGQNARIKLSDLQESYGHKDWGSLPVSALHLYRSETMPEGARYTILHTAALIQV